MSGVYSFGGEDIAKMLIDRVICVLNNLRHEKEADEFSLVFRAIDWKDKEKEVRKILISNSVPGYTTLKDPSNDDVFYVKVAKSEEFLTEYAKNNGSILY